MRSEGMKGLGFRPSKCAQEDKEGARVHGEETKVKILMDLGCAHALKEGMTLSAEGARS